MFHSKVMKNCTIYMRKILFCFFEAISIYDTFFFLLCKIKNMQFYIIGLFIIIFFYQISMYNSFKIKYETTIKKLNKDVENLEELQNQNKLMLNDLSKTVSSFENIDETIEYVDDKIDTFKKIDETYTAFQKDFGSQFDQVNQEIGEIDQEMESQFVQVHQEIENQFDQVNENIKTNEEELKMLNEETSTIEEKIKKIENDIIKDEEEKQQIEEESPFQKRLYDFQEKYLKGNETMIGVSSAVLALSSYFLVSRGKKKDTEDIKLTDSPDKDTSTITGKKAKTSKQMDKKKATLKQLLKNRPPPDAIPNTITTALTNKEKVGRLNETNAQTNVGPRVQKKNPKASLNRRPPPDAIPNTRKSNQIDKQSRGGQQQPVQNIDKNELFSNTNRRSRDKSNAIVDDDVTRILENVLDKEGSSRTSQSTNQLINRMRTEMNKQDKKTPKANLLADLNKSNAGRLNKTSKKASTQKPKTGGILNELISGRGNLKKTPVRTKNPKPAANTLNEQLALALENIRGKIAPNSGQQISEEWSYS